METATKPQIKASELRIGNWVKRGETLHKILPMDFIYLYGDEDTEFGAIYSPILLSPEILEKCGFKKSPERDNLFEVKRYCLLYLQHGSMFYIDRQGIEVKHLHQLQNLYYCLTGEELPVSL